MMKANESLKRVLQKQFDGDNLYEVINGHLILLQDKQLGKICVGLFII